MSRIKTPPKQESKYRNAFEDDEEIPDIPLHIFVVYGLVYAAIIFFLQYIVLRCTGAVMKPNICSFLLKGTLITLLLSIISVVIFCEQTLHFVERGLDEL